MLIRILFHVAALSALLLVSCSQPEVREAVPPTLVEEDPPEMREYRILRADYEQVVKDGLQNVMRWYFLQPHYAGEKFVGYKVEMVVKPEFENGPLFKGDVLLSVNDMPIERPEHAMAVWRSLWERKTLKLKLLRGDKETAYEIPIVDQR